MKAKRIWLSPLVYCICFATLLGTNVNRTRAEAYECVTEQVKLNGVTTNITDCSAITSIPKSLNERYFTYAAPYASGVTIPYTLGDMLGVVFSNDPDRSLKGFGFPDQQITWDGIAIENGYRELLDSQANRIPIRTPPIGNGFCSELTSSFCQGASAHQ